MRKLDGNRIRTSVREREGKERERVGDAGNGRKDGVYQGCWW